MQDNSTTIPHDTEHYTVLYGRVARRKHTEVSARWRRVPASSEEANGAIAKMILLLLFLLLPSWAWAIDRYAVATGGATSGTCPQGMPCTLAFLMGATSPAVAGDIIWLNDGTYPNQQFNTGKDGAAGAPITVKALNTHKAIFQRTKACTNIWDATSFFVTHNYWTFHGLRIQQTGTAFRVDNDRTGIIIEHNIVEDISHSGVFVDARVTNLTVRNNVFFRGANCNIQQADTNAAVFFSFADGTVAQGTNNSTVESNIIIGYGNNSDQCGTGGGCGNNSQHRGYALASEGDTDNNMIRGNLLIGNGGKGVLRIFSGPGSSSSGNTVRDNMLLFNDNGSDTSDNTDDSTSFINNLMVGNYFVNTGTKGNVSGQWGHHLWDHNTIIMTPFTWRAHDSFCSNGGCKVYMIFRNNLMYSTHNLAGLGNVLMRTQNQNLEFPAALNPGNNLFASPNFANMFNGYIPRGTDITNQTPVFTDAATGDYTLVGGSPGKKAATDGTDIGIAWNTYLKKAMVANAFALPTQENTGLNAATSTSFTVSNSNYYMVHIFIPQSGECSSTAEQFVIEGNADTALRRNISSLISSNWITGATQRYVTLGVHIATDGILNVNWTNANCVEKVHIRQMPTPDVAYTWLSAAPNQAPTAPTNLTIIE
jgi:hypothetical protein